MEHVLTSVVSSLKSNKYVMINGNAWPQSKLLVHEFWILCYQCLLLALMRWIHVRVTAVLLPFTHFNPTFLFSNTSHWYSVRMLYCANSTSTCRFYVFILFPKYNLMKIIRAINTSLDNNLSTEPPSLTIMFSISSFKSFIVIFINAWSYVS